MSRRVLLHVGTPKTGTSYLQDVLHKNRAKLLKQRRSVRLEMSGQGQIPLQGEGCTGISPHAKDCALTTYFHAPSKRAETSGNWGCPACFELDFCYPAVT